MEEDIFKLLSELGGEKLGVIGLVVGAILIFRKRFDTIFKILLALYEQKVFEKYNESLNLIQIKSVSYVFRSAYFKKDTSALFDAMKACYDLESIVNVPAKEIKFKLYEIPDESIIYSEVVRFLNYYKSKNGVKILFFIHEEPFNPADTKTKSIIQELKNYITKAEIHGAKIVKGSEPIA